MQKKIVEGEGERVREIGRDVRVHIDRYVRRETQLRKKKVPMYDTRNEIIQIPSYET